MISNSSTNIDLNASYGIQSGKTLYYNSMTNKEYNNPSFTKTPQPVADLINKALVDYKGTGKPLLLAAGEYLVNKPIIMQNGVKFTGVPGGTKLIFDDSFNKNYDDFCVSNVKNASFTVEGITFELRTGKKPVFGDSAKYKNAIEGILFKAVNTKNITINNCIFNIKNYGMAAAVCTNVWFRGGYNGVVFTNNKVENTSGGTAGGCLWFMCNDGEVGTNVNAWGNIFTKNGSDETISIWGYNGSHLNYKIYSNTINYVPGALNKSCDNLITVWSIDGGKGVYRNIKIVQNAINLTGLARRVFISNCANATFNNIEFGGNSIVDTGSDSTADTLLTVVEIIASQNRGETVTDMYARNTVTIDNNSYVNNSRYGRRCWFSGENSSVNIFANTVNSNFGYELFFEELGNVKINSNNNDYNYTGTGKSAYGFAHIRGGGSHGNFTNDRIALQGTSKSDSYLTFTNCTFK